MAKKKNDKKSKKTKSQKNRDEPKTSRERSNANLVKFEKGKSGNPLGRSKNVSSIPFNIREVGQEPIVISITTVDKKGKKFTERVKTTKAKAIVYRMYAKAMAGNDRAAKLLWERELGKPMQSIAIGVVDGEDINVIFRGADFLVEDEEGIHGDLINSEDADFTEGENGEAEKEDEK